MNSHSKTELAQRRGLADLIAALLPSEGVITPCDGLSVFRLNDSFGREPYSYNSEIIILAQGKKHVIPGK